MQDCVSKSNRFVHLLFPTETACVVYLREKITNQIELLFFLFCSVDENGRKKTTSVTQQCCRGFGRKKNSQSANIFMPCEELHLRSLIETSERLNGREFIRSVQKNDIDDELRKNVTLFLPTDATFTEFAEQLLESVRTICKIDC